MRTIAGTSRGSTLGVWEELEGVLVCRGESDEMPHHQHRPELVPELRAMFAARRGNAGRAMANRDVAWRADVLPAAVPLLVDDFTILFAEW
jgi:hypothetical protein